MPKQTEIDRIDLMIDNFEAAWSAGESNRLLQWLQRYELDQDSIAATELARVDIQRRYEAGLSVDLDGYSDQMPWLQADQPRLQEIAFEDYRSRRKHQLPLVADRWKHVPGVSALAWFNELLRTENLSAKELQNSNRPKISVFAGKHDLAARVPENAESEIRNELAELGFNVVSRLGEGALSIVYLATQRSLSDRHVVLKVVTDHLSEPDHLARLQHTNIVPIYSFHPLRGGSVICMPYWGSVTLESYLNENPSSIQRTGQSFVSTLRLGSQSTIVGGSASNQSFRDTNERQASSQPSLATPLESLFPLDHNRLTLWLFLRIADALAHAHARGVLHGDLKPANVLIRNDGEPALLDFNLSQRMDSVGDGITGGTLPYMPPEILVAMMGKPQKPRPESDIYSLGMILFEFVSGTLPFSTPRSTASIDLNLALEERQKAIRFQSQSAASPGLKLIIEKCLRFNIEDRYSNVEQLRRDLQREIDSQPLVHVRESWSTRAKKWAHRHPTLSSSATLIAVASTLVVLLGFSLVQYRHRYNELQSQETFEKFIDQSNDALAGMLAIDEVQWRDACAEADRCMAIYEVGQNSEWQSSSQLVLLDNQRRQMVLSRLTDLMYRSTFRLVEDWQEDQWGANAQLPIDLWTRIEILQSEPFHRFAPLSIERLKSREFGAELRDVNLIELGRDDNDQKFRLEQTLSEQPVDAFAEAFRRFFGSDYKGAIELLTPELLSKTDPFSFWILLGRSQLELNQLDAAELSFSMAIEQQRFRQLGLFYRGVCRMRKRTPGSIESAIEDFGTVIEDQPTWGDARVNRALAREVLGDLAGAVDDLAVAEKLNHNKHLVFLVRSRLHRKLNQPELAKRDLEYSFRESPTTVQGWISRSLARLPLDPSGAMSDLLKAKTLAPESLEVLQNQSHVYSEYLNEPQKAIQCLNEALELSPDFEKALLGRAVLYGRIGNVELALSDVKACKTRLVKPTPASMYQAACTLSLIFGCLPDDDLRRDQVRHDGFDFLARAIQNGYGSDLLESDPDLNAFRSHNDFEIIRRFLQLGGVRP